MSWNSKVIWSEGMFLEPQHFQQHDRFLEKLIDARVQANTPYGWGFLTLSVDETALSLGKVGISSARGVLPDGTPFDFPFGDASPAPIDIPADVRDELVVLALPLRRNSSAEVDLGSHDADNESALTRYIAGESEVTDTIAGMNRRAVLQLGQLRLRLMLQRDATDAYACLGVVRVVERRNDNQLVLDKPYIAPSVSVRGSALLTSFTREIYGLLHQRGEALAARLAHPGRGGVAEVADFLLLQTVNRYEPLFAHLNEVSLLHPERLHALCLQLAGDLSTFSRENRRPPDYLPYHHDDSEKSFKVLMNDLRRSLSMVLEANAIPIELQDRKYGVRVATIPDAELLRSASFVLAVNAQMSGETLRLHFPPQIKIGPVERIRDLVNLALPGIALRPLPVAPRQIPYHSGFNYFELERGGELWKQLEQSGGLAMHIAGDFPGLELEFWAIRS